MKKRTLFIFLAIILIETVPLFAQISHGGQPMPLSTTKSTGESLYVEMPYFDLKEQLHQDSLEAQDLKSGFRFAYKFITDYTPENSGIHFTTADGTRVWRLGIHSANAYSINLLFSKYELPEGASLFLYNADQTQIIGSFNHLNNSEQGILPIRPIDGDRVIVEYQEPENVAFHGQLQIGEVNHGYRDLRSYNEPQANASYFFCMNPVSYYQKQTSLYNNIARSVVLMIINGNTLCTGSLVNNTLNDKKPYVLTASHCLNDNFIVDYSDYEYMAGSIVFFFNYETPTSSADIRGTEEMSMASSHYRAANSVTDMALLELTEIPPIYYRPYYSGWNVKDVGEPPYTGIHHPRGSVKRINITDTVPILKDFFVDYYGFKGKNFWNVTRWLSGTTKGGSSGSPLFDGNNRIIGALTGGDPTSSCNNPINDYYYALSQSWTVSDNINKQLKHWLNPEGSNDKLTCDGLDPYESNPCYRLSNIRENSDIDSTEAALINNKANDYLFGTNSVGITEYAEHYKLNGKARIYGTYIVCPAITSLTGFKVEIKVYNSINGKPGNILLAETFNPTIQYYSTSDSILTTMNKELKINAESFVPFSSKIYASGEFFVGYNITPVQYTKFTVFSLKKGMISQNTAWMKYNNNWIEASNYPSQGFATSLYVDPVIQYITPTENESISASSDVQITFDADARTLHISLSEIPKECHASLISIDGKVLKNWKIDEQKTIHQLEPVQPGVYIIQIIDNGKQFVRKILL